MERAILEQRLLFLKLLQATLDTVDDKILANEVDLSGRMRPGGAINLDLLGDKVWLEQFR